ncbi:MAG TPA: cupin domain-containing protein [Candidatus Angelobacter sp.]|nr:cupin domain-containing protein [Candidatus Angelobacter sp.]
MASSPELSLAHLVAPQSVSHFFEHSWEKDSCLGQISEEYAERLMQPRDVETLSYSLSACARDWLRLIKDGRELPESLYSTGEALVDIAKVNHAYHSGYTIQLSKVHKRWLPVSSMCRHLEQELLANGIELSDRIGAHIYMTPPSAQGLGTHFDTQDVFILQLAGEKRWKVWEWTDRYPIERSPKPPTLEELPPLKFDLTLKKGDVLYIPRGVFHEACTTDQFSLHLSLSIYPATWMDMLQLALRESSLARAPITQGITFTGEKIAGMQTAIRNLLNQLEQPDSLQRAINGLRGRSLQRLDPLPVGALETEPRKTEISINTRLGRTTAPFVLCQENETPSLKWRDGVLKGNAANMAAFQQIASSIEFDVSDIPLKSEAARLALARELVAAGLFSAQDSEMEHG